MKKISAFTLGEVLIALSVIGVVASLVIPIIINGQKASTAQAQFNTAYSLISKAITDMEIANVPTNPAKYTTANSFGPAIRPFFKIVTECGVRGSSAAANKSVCPNGSGDYKTPNNKTSPGIIHTPYSDAFVLNNGMLISVTNYVNSENIKPEITYINDAGEEVTERVQNPVYISVDINGKNKLPNKAGLDLFTFEVTKDGLLPSGAPGAYPIYRVRASKMEDDKYCAFGDPPFANDDEENSYNSSNNGKTCSYWALADQDYFKKVYKNK